MGELSQEVEKLNAPAIDDGLLCPKCGYDMRIDTGERCSECGEIIDRAALAVSGFPWAHRRTIGRIAGYLKTFWLVSIGSRRLKNEASKPQDLGAARVFAWINGTLMATVFIGIFISAAVESRGLSFMAVHPPELFARVKTSRWVHDLQVPWSSGTTLWPVMPLMLVGLGFYLTGVQRRLFRVAELSTTRRERAEAIGWYASAPLVWWPLALGVITIMYLPTGVSTPLVQGIIAILFLLMMARVWLVGSGWRRMLWVGLLAMLGSGCMFLAWLGIEAAELYGRHPARISVVWALGVVGVGLPLLRCAQWSARVKHRGGEYMMLDIPYLLGLWLVGIVVLLGVLPWCIGFVWLVIDSFL
jgi:hypothetical protein